MKLWLKKVFEEADKTYEELPDWKKNLSSREDFARDQETSRIRQKRYNSDDWT